MTFWSIFWSIFAGGAALFGTLAIFAIVRERLRSRGATPTAALPPVTAPSPSPAPSPAQSTALHIPVQPAPLVVRIGILAASAAILLYGLFIFLRYVLSSIGVEGFYIWTATLAAWVICGALASKLFIRQIGVYQLAHTQDLFGGQLRRYEAGMNLLLPWETLTEDHIVDTETRVIPIPEIRISTGDGSPMIGSGQIRYHVDPALSHQFIGVRKEDVETSLLGIAAQIMREETARFKNPESALQHLGNRNAGSGRVILGLIGTIEDLFMNGPRVTRIEKDHGIKIAGVPISIRPAAETETIFLERFQDKRLAESAEALVGKEEQARLALLNNKDSHLTHTIMEDKKSGEQKTRTEIDISGTAGDSLKELVALGAAVAQSIAAAKGSGTKNPPPSSKKGTP